MNFIEFKIKSDIVVSCGMKMVRLWDKKKGEPIHAFESPGLPLDISFDNEILLIATQKKYLGS